MFALIGTEELEELGQIMVKQLKNRYNDPTINKRFVVGIDINAQLFLRYDQNIPEILYYKLDPVKDSDVPNFKYEIILDDTNRNIINYV